MKSKLKIIFSAVLFVILLALTAAGYLLMTKHRANANSNDQYSIVVEDEITVHVNNTYTLVPYLVRNDGTIQESRFAYSSSTDNVSVSDDGVVSVKNAPAENEKVEITIYEKNTSTTATVNVNVIDKLAGVQGLVFSDEGGEKQLLAEEHSLNLNGRYVLEFKTEPRNVDINKYSQITLADANGAQKNLADIFNVKVENAQAILEPIGLGSGTLNISVKNDDGQNIYSKSFDFSIEMANSALGKAILKSANSVLLSKEELKNISVLSLDDNVSGDISELQKLEKLQTVTLVSDAVMNLQGISDKYCYRVKDVVFDRYLEAPEWENYLNHVIPYKDTIEEMYVVYHSDKVNDGERAVTFEAITDSYELPTFLFKGYMNTGWVNDANQAVTAEDIKGLDLNGVHIFAKWNPIEFSVNYHVRGQEEQAVSESWNYETNSQLKDITELCDKSIKGYKFIGWTTDPSVEYDTVRYEKGKSYGQDEMTINNGDVINLYDVWTLIEYTIRFEYDSKYEATQIADRKLKYTSEWTLPAGEAKGYTFINWLDENGTPYEAGQSVKELCETDGGIVLLSAQLEAHNYVIEFNKNTPLHGTVPSTTIQNVPCTYDVVQKLPTNTYAVEGWTFKGWATTNAGQVAYKDSDNVKNLTASDDATVTLYAVWEVDPYKVINTNIATNTIVSDTSSQGVSYIIYRNIDNTPWNPYRDVNEPNWDSQKHGAILDWSRETVFDVSRHTNRVVLSGRYNNVDILNNVFDVYFIGSSGNTFTNLHLSLCKFKSGQKLKINFVNFNFTTNEQDAIALSDDGGMDLTVNVVGDCTVDSTYGGGKIFNLPGASLTITGAGNLTVKGGNGKSDGQNGGAGIIAQNLTITGSGKIAVTGGNGQFGNTPSPAGTGNPGIIGGKGGNGGAAVSVANIVVDAPSADMVFSGGIGGTGGTGGAGGTGKKGNNGNALSYSGHDGGDGGVGGKGGTGGTGGTAAEVSGSVTFISGKFTLKGGNGGNGGNGGVGGNGGAGGAHWGLLGSNGKQGYGGAGGAGGTGGTAGKCCSVSVPSNVNQTRGNDGATGNKGDNGKGR